MPYYVATALFFILFSLSSLLSSFSLLFFLYPLLFYLLSLFSISSLLTIVLYYTWIWHEFYDRLPVWHQFALGLHLPTGDIPILSELKTNKQIIEQFKNLLNYIILFIFWQNFRFIHFFYFQARFQQKQLQERELKIASLYEAQQARALDRVRQSPSNGVNTASPQQPTPVSHQPGKVSL